MKNNRLLSIDILRGIAIVGMILVNNVKEESFFIFKHSYWNGLTLSDLVFPFFLYVIGITTYISLSKYNFQVSWPLIGKVTKRTFVLFVLGLIINYAYFVSINGNFLFHDVRVMGVLQRIALCYFIVSVISLIINHRIIPILIFFLLIVYSAILLFMNGYATDNTNIAMLIDEQLFNYSHLYHERPIDPEGLLGILPCVAHTLIGFLFGQAIVTFQEKKKLINVFIIIGFSMFLLGILLSPILPVNKCVWSPTFVLVTCGIASIIEAMLIYLVDDKHYGHYFMSFFIIFGINSLFIYVMSGAITVLFSVTGISAVIYHFFYMLTCCPPIAAFLYSLVFVCLNFAIAYYLYVKKIFIKL